MNEPIGKPLRTDVRVRQKSLALLGTAAVLGIALYTSRFAPSSAPAEAPDERKRGAPTLHAVAAAEAFLSALDANQRGKVTYDFGSTRKSRWSNLPASMVPRNGVRLGDLTRKQRALAMDVVASVVSKSGYQKIVDIMDADQQLVGDEAPDDRRGRRPMFGVDQYYLAIFGKPSGTEPWMVQFGGHHLGLNVTVIGKYFMLTPTHTGAQPARFQRAGKAVRPLGLENDAAFELVNALNKSQRGQAVLGERPQRDLLLGPGRDARKAPPSEGIKGSALTRDQETMLLAVIGAWVNIAEPDAAARRMVEVKRTIGETYFAWIGPTAKGSAAYFRVQGPTVWIEYAPQGSADHIHTVVRNPKDDYGAGILQR